jgi:hypothetical protein
METAMHPTPAFRASIAFVFAVAALGSTSAFAGQEFGRGSVYAPSGVSMPAAKATWIPVRQGRGSVYAQELAPPTPKDMIRVAVSPRPGRS